MVHDEKIKSEAIHEGFGCDGCAVTPIRGNRYHCLDREDYDICEICHKQGLNAELNFKVISEAIKIEEEPETESKIYVSYKESAEIVDKFKQKSMELVNN